MVDWGIALQLLGTLGLGSVLGQYLSSGGQRRETRAEVLRALSACEQSRWHPHDAETLSLSLAGRDLMATSIVARIPPTPVRVYLTIAAAASRASKESWEMYHDEETGGGIDTDMAELASDAATLITDLAWSPWRHRLGLNRRVASLEARTQTVEQAKHVKWHGI